MRKISLTFIALLAFTFGVLAQSDVSKARKQNGPINIDGNDKEWTQPLNFYDNNSGLMYAISNDREHVYLVFSVSDPMKIMKLMRSGWSIELSSKEKKRKFDATLSFPAEQGAGNHFQRGSNEKENRAEGYLMINDYESQLRAVSLHGFLSGQTDVRLNSRKGIQVSVGSNSDHHLIYEIAIPISELMAENAIRLNELITLNVNVNPMTRPTGAGGRPEGGMSEGGGRRGGGMSGIGGGRSGGGGRMGGGMRGGGMEGGGYKNGGSGDRSALSEKASFKQKFVLVGN